MELINVPHIFDHSSVKPYLPTDIKFGDPTVLYWLIKSIKSKTFHFNEFVSNLNFPVFAQGNAILPWNSAGSGFRDKDHRHIDDYNK